MGAGRSGRGEDGGRFCYIIRTWRAGAPPDGEKPMDLDRTDGLADEALDRREGETLVCVAFCRTDASDD